MTVAQIRYILEKIELAARRAVADKYPNGAPTSSLLQAFADQLCKAIKEMEEANV